MFLCCVVTALDTVQLGKGFLLFFHKCVVFEIILFNMLTVSVVKFTIAIFHENQSCSSGVVLCTWIDGQVVSDSAYLIGVTQICRISCKGS
jgi:hypothetical protein